MPEIKDVVTLLKDDKIFPEILEFVEKQNLFNREINLFVDHMEDLTLVRDYKNTNEMMNDFLRKILVEKATTYQILNFYAKSHELLIMYVAEDSELLDKEKLKGKYQYSCKYNIYDKEYIVFIADLNVFKKDSYVKTFLKTIKEEVEGTHYPK